MKKLPPTLRNTEPHVAVGGVGGSGTRVVAELLIKAGVHMGAHLNGSSDNLDFTEYFKRPDWFVEFPTNDMLAAAWQAFVVSQDAGREALGDRQLWGWKEPNTHIFLPFLRDQAGEMKYIHVIRNGLDMAFSNNLQQAKNWGKFILGEDVEDPRSPGWALEYWIAANQRALDVGRAMGRRFLPVFYERLCGDPKHEISRIFEFLNLDQDPENFLGLIKPPKSIGRYAANDLSHFSERQISLVEEIIGGSLGTQTIG